MDKQDPRVIIVTIPISDSILDVDEDRAALEIGRLALEAVKGLLVSK